MNSKIQYEEPLYLDPAFPILFHDDYLDTSRRSIYPNWHPSIEVLCCKSGRGHVLIDGETVPFGEENVVVINGDAIHTISADTDACTYDCLIVDIRFLSAQGFDLNTVTFNCALSGEAVQIFSRIREEFWAEKECYKQAVLAYVLLLFACLYRTGAAHTHKARANASKYQRTIGVAINYIRAHLREKITVDTLCQEAGVSKFYFCRLFRAYTGLSVVEYIGALRCEFARRLMLEEGYNVSQAAYYMGFDNLSYFSQLYRKQVGVSPSKELTRASARKGKGREYGMRNTLHPKSAQ